MLQTEALRGRNENKKQKRVEEFTSEYGISKALHSELPGPEDRIVDFSEGKIHLSQLSVIGAAKVSHFEINCRVLNIVPTLSLFRVLYTPSFNSGWMSFSKRPGKNTPQCYTNKKLEQPFLLDGQEGVPDYCGLAHKCSKGRDASREFVFPRGCDDTEHTSHPNPETTRSTTLLGRVEPQILPGRRDMDLFSLIRAPNPTKVKTGSRPRAAHEVSLLTVTANRVIEMEDPATTTDSSGVPSTIERSPLDFANENPSQPSTGPKDPEAAAPEVPPLENVTTTRVALEAGQAEGVAATESTRGGKSLAAIKLGMGSTRPVLASQGVPMDVSDPDLLSFADPQLRPLADVANLLRERPRPEIQNKRIPRLPPWSGLLKQYIGLNEQYNVNLARQVAMGSQLRLRFEQEAKLLNKSVAQVARQDKRILAQENEIKNLETLLEAETDMKKAAENKSAELCKELESMRAHDRRWVIGHGLCLAVMKCGESTELRQAFADVVSKGIAKRMSDGLTHRMEHEKADINLEAIEAYDPKAEAKYITALHALKDLKYTIVDQLESLKDAPMDVKMASLHLESDTRDDAPQWIRELRPSSS
nr:hypothetical protein [Tanacetum cinerariifolium]